LCAGDCNHTGSVTVDEILTMDDIAFGSLSFSTCPEGDANNDGRITVDDILTAVQHALTGCPTNSSLRSTHHVEREPEGVAFDRANVSLVGRPVPPRETLHLP
jgi:hypothetical protein